MSTPADATGKSSEREVPLEKRLDDLYDVIDDVEVALLTTRRKDGSLVSRPMQTQRRTGRTDLWFMTNMESETFEELALDPHVNVAYFKPRTGEWVSVSGHALLERDRDLIDGLYREEWKQWLPDQGDGKRNGGPHDPRIALVLVEADSVVYSKNNRMLPLRIFQAVKSKITGAASAPEVSEIRPEELRRN